MKNAVSRRYKRCFQIGGLLIAIILLFAGKSHISDMVSYLAYHGGLRKKSIDTNKNSAGIGSRSATANNLKNELPFHRPYSSGISRENYESS
jgi:hypothetical protein